MPEPDCHDVAVFDGKAQVAQFHFALAWLAQPRVLLAAAIQGGQVVKAVEAEALRQQLVEPHASAQQGGGIRLAWMARIVRAMFYSQQTQMVMLAVTVRAVVSVI